MQKMKDLSFREKVTKRLLEEYDWESTRRGILDGLKRLGKDIPLTSEMEV